jgi:hypothetical protein
MGHHDGAGGDNRAVADGLARNNGRPAAEETALAYTDTTRDVTMGT